ncbi:MAG: DUF1552 domain-containing protein [Acidobacteria bacterium]|nr:MAG: DUF1552 domain-containing protein [Acidobacteriota bacterium]
MFITKKHLDRRTFLRGVGATIALPLFDAMIPARTALAATAARPMPRMAFVYFPHGAIMNEWTPADAGGPVRLGRILEPLAAFKSRLTIVSGLENRHAYGPVHALTPGTWLSGVSPHPLHPSHPLHPDSSTVDQIAAQHIGRNTLLPSIEIATEAPKKIGAGAWEGDYSESFGTTISFRGSSMLPMEFSPLNVFDKLFASGSTADERARRARSSTSVLDLVAADAADVQTRLGPADCAVLRNYLDAVRDVERRVERACPERRRRAEARMPPSVESPADVSNAFVERMHLMFDLIALAFQADITRVASFMMAAETSQMTYDHADVPDPFHLLSHHQNDPAKIDRLVRIQSYHTRAFAAFVGKLADLPDGDGSILDRSLVLYGSNMSNSHAHDHFPLPLAVVGGGCGTLRGGQHLRYPDHTPHSNLLVTMLLRAGVPVESIGDSTGECAEV